MCYNTYKLLINKMIAILGTISVLKHNFVHVRFVTLTKLMTAVQVTRVGTAIRRSTSVRCMSPASGATAWTASPTTPASARAAGAARTAQSSSQAATKW